MTNFLTDDGAKSGLAKSLGLPGSVLITLSCVAPSIAVFIVGSDSIRQVGSAVIPCFAAAAVFGLAMACIYGELGSAFPSAGGEYSIFKKVFRPSWSRGVLGLNLLGFSMSLALSGFGVATYLAALWPGLPARPLAAALVALVTLIALLRIRVSAVVTGAFVFVELLTLVIVSVLGAEHIRRPFTTDLFPAALAGGLSAGTIGALGAATAAGIYAFNGYGAAIFFGEDMHDARKHVAPAVLLALLAAIVMVMPPLALVILGSPDLHALVSTSSPISAFIASTGGPVLARAMSAAVGLAIFNTMIAIALMAGRQLYATGRDNLWPDAMSAALAATHSRWGSPWAATVVMGCCGLLACLLDPHSLVLILGNSNVLTYSGLCIAALHGRRARLSTPAAWRMPAFPAPPLFGLVFLGGVAVLNLLDPAGRLGLLISVATFAASMVIFRGVEWSRRFSGAQDRAGPLDP